MSKFFEDIDEVLHFKIDAFQPFANDQTEIGVVLRNFYCKALAQLKFELLKLGAEKARTLGV